MYRTYLTQIEQSMYVTIEFTKQIFHQNIF